MSGGVHKVYVEDCSYAGKVIYGFYLKVNRDRGGMVHDIYARNLEFDTTLSTPMIDSIYKNQGSCCPPAFIRNVHIKSASQAKEVAHMDHLVMEDVTINGEAIEYKGSD